MVTSKRELVLSTAVLSGLAAAMLVTSFATTSWVTGSLRSNPSGGQGAGGLLSLVSHGLFEGELERVVSVNNQLDLSIRITCLMEHNACAWSCQPSAELRRQEAEQLWSSGCVTEEQVVQGCSQLQGNITGNGTGDGCPLRDRRFTNAGLWVCTVLLLAASLVMAAACAALGVYNSASSPARTWLGVPGLYACNGVAAALNLATMVLWGAQFASVLVGNITYTEVITGGFSNHSVSLGYSYWLLLAALFLHCVNVVLLYLRQYLLDHESPPASPGKLDENNDGVIYLY
ncbi:uncharacterized protein LOC134534472 [Bacillus rossius redtenbacheri]|uniref:uncharacterized protein LOC134534472 n=1 Tax=Bacillus rossius redtenbacheri TaxID=93214 RepID=UPI002FDD9020